MIKMYKFLANEALALDGRHTQECKKGVPLPIPNAELAATLLEQGRIVEADAETTVYETKDAPTPEKKVAKKKAAKKSKKKG